MPHISKPRKPKPESETMNYEGLVGKTLKTLKKVDPNWNNESTAMLGIGYAILTLAAAIKETTKK